MLNRNCAQEEGRGGHLLFAFDPKLTSCPRRAFEPLAYQWLSTYIDWRMSDGRLLPYAGRLEDQPAYVWEAFKTLQGAFESETQRQRLEGQEELKSRIEALKDKGAK